MALEEVERKKEYKEYLSATVAPGLIKAIDEIRSTLPYQISRSQYVQKALTERLEKDNRIRSSK